MTVPNISIERLKEVFEYRPSTGELVWRVRINRHMPMTVAGHLARSGYVEVGIDGQRLMAHRVIWCLVTGSWPTGQIDHKDTSKTNNRFENLRDTSPATNSQNQQRAHKNNKSGLLGVGIAKGGKFSATIKANRRRFYIGVFETPIAAHQAYLSAKRRLHEGNLL